MSKNLYGTEPAKVVMEKLQLKCQNLKPQLAIVLVGDDFGSRQYTKQIEKSAGNLGIETQVIEFDESVAEATLIGKIKELNLNKNTDGIIVQLPLPSSINTQKVIETIDPGKDVDGLHPYNLGRLMAGLPALVPCTAKAVMRLLEYYNYELTGKNVAIVGRSLSVGKPLSALMTKADATVILCHSKTEALFQITQKADIIVAAIGKALFFDDSYFNASNVVIDVGINSVPQGICGDVDYQKVAEKVAAITPVPKGVGSLTIAMLMENLVMACENRRRTDGLQTS